jgi:energy-coupling factor transport system substrate-specific component
VSRSVTTAAMAITTRPVLVYVLVVVVGCAAFLWPFFLPAEALPAEAHGTDAPLIAAAVGALAVVAVMLEVRRGTMNGATVALLGVLAASAGLLRLLNLPGGGSGIFFLVILAGAAFGPRFGLLLGLCAMTVSAVVTGGLGPWLPFQMLALAWMGGAAGLLGRITARAPAWIEIAVLAAFGWMWGFLYGGILNLWFWPFVGDTGGIWYEPGLDLAETVRRYLAFYALTSFAWDAAAAFGNAALIVVTGAPLLRSMRRFAHRLDPVVELSPLAATGSGLARAAREG